MVFYLSKDGLERLKNYKYKGSQYTIGDNLLNPFWLWTVEFMPMWLAPNMITLLGTIIMMMGCGSFLFFDLSMTENPPAIMAYIAGLTVFIYQTLDAIDGKQARRTGQSSPLGQLFDHGCDAMSLFWIQIGNIAINRLGSTWETYIPLACTTMTCYMVNWEEFHTGVLRTSVGYFGVTEGQLFMVGLFFINGYTNGECKYWKVSEMLPFVEYPDFMKDLSVINLAHIFLLYQCLATFIMSLYNVATQSKKFIKAMKGLIPLTQYVICIYILFAHTEWANQYPGLALLILQPVYCVCIYKQILCNVSEMEFNCIQGTPIVFGMFLINKYYMGENQIEEWKVASGVYAFTFVIFCHVVHTAISQICQYLDINCLTIKHHKKVE